MVFCKVVALCFIFPKKTCHGKQFKIGHCHHQRYSIKNADLKNFAIFTGKQLCWSLGLQKKRLQHRCFPVNIGKFLRNIWERLLLNRWHIVISQWAVISSEMTFPLILIFVLFKNILVNISFLDLLDLLLSFKMVYI